MNTIFISRSEFNSGRQMYDVIKEKWQLPDYFGKNVDALWDMITGYIELPAKVILQGFGGQESVEDSFYIHKIIDVFKDSAKECGGDFLLEFID